MYLDVKTGQAKSPKTPNPLSLRLSCAAIFRNALQERRDKHPFTRVSAYKVRESWENLRYECDVVASIAKYLQLPASVRHSGMLLGCTSDDKARRLKVVPEIIAREMGYNLIPAVEALHLEGVSKASIADFLRKTKPNVNQLLEDCDAVAAATCRSIKSEYFALAAGQSAMTSICADALNVATQAMQFCKNHQVLQALQGVSGN